MPITWQNINGPSLADAYRPLDGAEQSFRSAFSGLRDVLKESEAINTANWQNTKVNNTNAGLNTINQFATPEEYQAALKSGAIASLISANGAQVDQQALRAAADQRLGVLQTRAKAAGEYQDYTTDRAQAPERDRVASDLASGDPLKIASAKAWLDTNQLRNEAPLYSAANAAGQQVIDRDRGTTEFGWKGEEFKSNQAAAKKKLQVDDANIAQSYASAENSRAAAKARLMEAQIAQTESQLGAKGQGKAGEALRDAFVKNSVLSAGTIDTKEGRDYLTKWVSENTKGWQSSAQVQDLMANIAMRAEKGIEIGKDKDGKPIITKKIPVMTVIDAISQSGENPLASLVPGWSRRGDDADNLLVGMMQNKDLQNEIGAVLQVIDNSIMPGISQQANRAQEILGKSRPVPPRGGNGAAVLQATPATARPAERDLLAEEYARLVANKPESALPQTGRNADVGFLKWNAQPERDRTKK